MIYRASTYKRIPIYRTHIHRVPGFTGHSSLLPYSWIIRLRLNLPQFTLYPGLPCYFHSHMRLAKCCYTIQNIIPCDQIKVMTLKKVDPGNILHDFRFNFRLEKLKITTFRIARDPYQCFYLIKFDKLNQYSIISGNFRKFYKSIRELIYLSWSIINDNEC